MENEQADIGLPTRKNCSKFSNLSSTCQKTEEIKQQVLQISQNNFQIFQVRNCILGYICTAFNS